MSWFETRDTANNLVYAELNRPDIISVIKDRQCAFLQKLLLSDEHDAIAKKIWKEFMSADNKKQCLEDFRSNIDSSDRSMDVRGS